MKLNLEVRTFDVSDEDNIAILISLCFDTFSRFKIDGRKWLRYKEIDPGFILQGAIIAEYQNKILGHVQIVLRNLRIGKSIIEVAGIANVCVHPNYRRCDAANKLLDYSHAMTDSLNLPISALLVQPGSPAWSLYSKQGYRNVHLLEDVTCGIEEMRQMVRPIDESREIVVRDYLSGDEEIMLEIYNSASESLVGIQKRDLDYWRRRYISVLTYDGFFYEPFDPEKVLVAEDNGIICGYCFLSILNGKGYIREIFTLPEKEFVIDYLTAKAFEKFASRGVLEIVFLKMLALLHPTFWRIAKSGKVRISPHDQLMIKIISLSGLIRSMEQEILERLRDLIPLTIGLSIDGSSLALKIMPDRIDFDPGLEGCNPIFSMSEESFLKLLFGAASADSVIEDANTSIMPGEERSKKILRTLFPKKSFYLSSGDVW